MQSLIGKKVFSTANKDYYWEHIIASAILSGEWSRLEDRTRNGIACSKRMDDTEEYPDQDDLNERAAEFRYERDLISAEEAEFWLSKQGIILEEWMSYILNSVLRELWADDLQQIVTDYPVSKEEVNEFITVEGICSDELNRICRELAGHVAICERYKPLSTQEQPSKEFHFPFDIDSDRLSEVKRDIAFIESGFQEFYKQLITPESLSAEIKMRGSDLIRFDLETLGLSSQQAAKETVLCITEDHRSLQEIAEEAGLSLQKQTLYFFQMESDWRDALLAKQPGEFVGPVQSGDLFAVAFIRNKTMPSVKDREMARLAEHFLLTRVKEHEINNRIRWHI